MQNLPLKFARRQIFASDWSNMDIWLLNLLSRYVVQSTKILAENEKDSLLFKINKTPRKDRLKIVVY